MAVAAALALPGMVNSYASPNQNQNQNQNQQGASTPIKHVVVIFGENVSFDHYFATYPNATNPAGEPSFTAAPNTPAVNGLAPSTANGETNLIADNPNGVSPQRQDPQNVNDVLTCDQNHAAKAEQAAFDQGKMDMFLQNVATGTGNSPEGQPCNADVDLDYYDGNTVTAMWNYAQHFAMSDNSFGTTFGPSTPGAVNVISGDTGNVDASKTLPSATTNSAIVPDGQGGFTDIGDTAPYYDDCPDSSTTTAFTGQNIGDQLNKAGLSWGWFQGGFAPTTTAVAPTDDPGYVSPDKAGGYETGDSPAVCGSSHNIGAILGGTGKTGAQAYGTESDYLAHHEPFQYFASTANPHHLAPTSLSAVGTDTESYVNGVPQFNTANHQYDMSTFNNLLTAIDNHQLSPNHLPAVSYLKAPGYEDGHQGYSDPLDEQNFVTTEVNAIESSPDWKSTAIILNYDDSDGFYDHVDAATENGGQPQNASQVAGLDSLTAPGMCGTATPVLTNSAGQPEQGRCGLGPRLPFLVISPWSKSNFVSHTMTDQSSIVKFVEDNWHLGGITGSAANIAGSIDNMFNFNQKPAAPLFLSNTSGEQISGSAGSGSMSHSHGGLALRARR